MKKRDRLSIEVNPAEKAEVRAKAAMFGMTESEYGHWHVFGQAGGILSPVAIMHAQSNIGLAHSCARRMEATLMQNLAGVEPAVRDRLLDELTDMMVLMGKSHQGLMPPDSQQVQNAG
ncbi:hypothetical protein IQ266_21955 [filamentous cyanobacterium LEGE 11480]|uniref:Uncharacterized protein n=1 Tax=Romeriopsis navalis LEGE 11480 TaxID=2777977 RepID=A0A928VTS9_9CYAN|nr:hypothetical protein [Romeriopsis navalis]MBE9032407.1 hypothetical protein [Romeriopsis navalis LEGE 11480]